VKAIAKLAIIALTANTLAFAAEPEDKDLTILHLQKVIAEQSMNELLRDERVKEYVRIRTNYERVMGEIEKKEKAAKENK